VDLGSRIAAGALQSLSMGAAITILTMTIGLFMGTLAAVAPTPVSRTVDQITDSFMAFPGLLFAILLAALMPHSRTSVIFALSITGWTSRARFCRALLIRALALPHIESAKALGCSPVRVVTHHLWPTLWGQLLAQTLLSMSYAIMAEASLSFLGLGGSTDNASWGKLIAEGREYLVEAPHLSVFPGLAFLGTVLALNLIAEKLRRRYTEILA
jgi:peptide/nickel transport system permease protein